MKANERPGVAVRSQFSLRGLLAVVSITCVICWTVNRLSARFELQTQNIAMLILLGAVLGSLYAFFVSGQRDATILGGIFGCAAVWLTLCVCLPAMSEFLSGPRWVATAFVGGLGLTLLFFPGVAVGTLLWRLFRG